MRVHPTICICIGLLVFFAPAALAQFSIPWLTVDGGGGTHSGGAFTLEGTVGQPDAGETMTGGTFSLSGGYWGAGSYAQVAVVDDDEVVLPTQPLFGPPVPNPAFGRVAFYLALPEAASVDLVLYDVAGRRVLRLQEGRLEAGEHRFRWDGRDDRGRSRGAGVYFARLLVDNRLVGQRRIVFLK